MSDRNRSWTNTAPCASRHSPPGRYDSTPIEVVRLPAQPLAEPRAVDSSTSEGSGAREGESEPGCSEPEQDAEASVPESTTLGVAARGCSVGRRSETRLART